MLGLQMRMNKVRVRHGDKLPSDADAMQEGDIHRRKTISSVSCLDVFVLGDWIQRFRCVPCPFVKVNLIVPSYERGPCRWFNVNNTNHQVLLAVEAIELDSHKARMDRTNFCGEQLQHLLLKPVS
jgi:hypothetical protein